MLITSDKEENFNVARGIKIDSRPCQKQCNPEDSNGSKVLKENRTVNLEFYTQQKIFFKYKDEMKTFSNIERVIMYVPALRSIKGSLSGRKLMIASGNLGLHEGMKNIRNEKYVHKYKILFYLRLKISLKEKRLCK